LEGLSFRVEIFCFARILFQFRAKRNMKFSAGKRRIEITVEKSETVSVRRRIRTATGQCSRCGREAKMASPEDAAEILQISKRRIYSGIEAGDTHFVESGDGILLVCLDSLERGSHIDEGESDRS
jgi:hypothetical protein